MHFIDFLLSKKALTILRDKYLEEKYEWKK